MSAPGTRRARAVPSRVAARGPANVSGTRTAVAALVALALAGPPCAGAAPSPEPGTAERLGAVRSFALAIGDGALGGRLDRRYGDYDLVVLDGAEASSAKVAALRASGAIVLGYLSVGTIERYRWWYPAARRYRLERWGDWPDEHFADVSRPGYRRLIARRVAPRMLARGFDGLFLDNVDMIDGRPRRRACAGATRRRCAGSAGACDW